MIREVTKNDFNRVYELGISLNKNYKDLFNLELLSQDVNNKILVYEKQNVLIGFIHILKLYEVTEIINIVVDKSYQRNGFGSDLINEVIMIYPENEIILEVRSKNKTAINFYKKLNFKLLNIRKKYYSDDDAYVMKRSV